MATTTSSPTTTTTTTSTSTSTTPTIGLNALVVPSNLGDPVTCLDVDEKQGFMMVGYASGRICSWRIDHINTPYIQQPQKTPPPHHIYAYMSSITIPHENEYICRVMSKGSDEGIKDIFIEQDKAFALVGDIHIKYWGSHLDPTYQLLKYKRLHNFAICSNTYILRYQSVILLLTAGLEEGHQLNLDTMEQSSVALALPKKCQPLYFDGNRLTWLQTEPDGEKSVRIINFATMQPLHTFVFSKVHKFYWGFQLSGNRMAHVCCQTKLKVWDLSNTERYAYKFIAHKKGRVVAFLFDDDGHELISLGSDHKLKVWRDGVLIQKIKGLVGEFLKGYPYLLRRFGSRVFYTADDGIYCVSLS